MAIKKVINTTDLSAPSRAVVKLAVVGSKGVEEVNFVDDAQSQRQGNEKEIEVIVKLSREMVKLEMRLDQLEIERKETQDKLTKLEMETLPERMAVAGLTQFRLSEGFQIEVAEFIRASIPSQGSIDDAEPGMERDALLDRRNKAMGWLKKHNGEALIKNKLTAEFGKGESKAAKKFSQQIEKAGYKSHCEESVNFQTLNSFIRESLQNGVDVPEEPFSLFQGKKAVIKQIKAKK
jgi:hypothetical protein